MTDDRETLRMKRRTNERGASALEFALVMPILVMLVFGIISFGFLFAQDLALGNAARQTARYSVVENRSCDDVSREALAAAAPLVTLPKDAAHIEMKRGTEGGAKIAVCTSPTSTTEKPCAGSADRDNIYVRLNYTADVLLPVIPGMGSTMDLDGTGVFRCEWF